MYTNKYCPLPLAKNQNLFVVILRYTSWFYGYSKILFWTHIRPLYSEGRERKRRNFTRSSAHCVRTVGVFIMFVHHHKSSFGFLNLTSTIVLKICELRCVYMDIVLCSNVRLALSKINKKKILLLCVYRIITEK